MKYPKILGGDIELESQPDQGSTFTLILPVAWPNRADVGSGKSSRLGTAPERVGTGYRPGDGTDNSNRLTIYGDGPDILLIGENPARIGHWMAAASEQGGKQILHCPLDQAVLVAKNEQPTQIILFDTLPRTETWSTLNALKHCADTRHLPVQLFMPMGSEATGLDMGAVGNLGIDVGADQAIKSVCEHDLPAQKR